jgi:SAM-dependent methyltransferase
MPDFYQKNYKVYHEKTFSIDPSSFLAPLAKRLPAEAFILDVGCGSGRDLLEVYKRLKFKEHLNDGVGTDRNNCK